MASLICHLRTLNLPCRFYVVPWVLSFVHPIRTRMCPYFSTLPTPPQEVDGVEVSHSRFRVECSGHHVPRTT